MNESERIKSNASDIISLREYFERILSEKDRVQSIRDAVIDRRLNDLNHSAERERQRDVVYMSREAYEARHREVVMQLAGLERLVYIGFGIVLAMGTIVQILLHFYGR